MKEIVEFLFECVSKDALYDFLVKWVSDGSMIDYQVTSALPNSEFTNIDVEPLLRAYAEIQEGTIYIKVAKFKVDEKSLDIMGIQVLRYEDQIDLAIDIESEVFLNEMGPRHFQEWAGKLAVDLDAATYFCGYEPAIDEETRFFTEDKLGPIL